LEFFKVKKIKKSNERFQMKIFIFHLEKYPWQNIALAKYPSIFNKNFTKFGLIGNFKNFDFCLIGNLGTNNVAY